MSHNNDLIVSPICAFGVKLIPSSKSYQFIKSFQILFQIFRYTLYQVYINSVFLSKLFICIFEEMLQIYVFEWHTLGVVIFLAGYTLGAFLLGVLNFWRKF